MRIVKFTVRMVCRTLTLLKYRQVKSNREATHADDLPDEAIIALLRRAHVAHRQRPLQTFCLELPLDTGDWTIEYYSQTVTILPSDDTTPSSARCNLDPLEH